MSEPEQEVEASPVTKTARDLTEITRLAEALDAQAVAKSNDRLMPGGLAMVALAPVANLEAWESTYETAERINADDTRRHRPVEHIADEDDSWEPPLQTLLFWSEQWRAVLGAEYGMRPTVKTEAEFLKWLLNWAWDHESHFDEFAADIARARTRLEATLCAGTLAERSRVVCDRCEDAPRLLKVYGDEESGKLDRWKCPSCKHKFDRQEFLDAHARQLRHESAAKFVSQRDAIGTLVVQGRAERTIRKWLGPPIKHIADRCTNRKCRTPKGKRRAWTPGENEKCPACESPLEEIKRGDPEAVVEGYCDLVTHKTWIWWPDLWRLHLTTPNNRKRDAA